MKCFKNAFTITVSCV